MDRAHIQDGMIKGLYHNERGRIALANGDTVMPIVVGYVSPDGRDKIIPIETEIDDQSTSAYTTESQTEILEENRVLITKEIQDIPVTSDQVKAEAYRRISDICPEWKQRNLTAQAAILAEKGRTNWTAEELTAWTAGEAIWASIAAIRAASDALELMNPIPADFTDNSYWP